MGIMVTLSTFLAIGASSSLTYNVVGHIKTVIIICGGVIFFDETMPWKKAMGVAVAMAGMGWYTWLVSKGAGAAQQSQQQQPQQQVPAMQGGVGGGIEAAQPLLQQSQYKQ